MYDFDKQQDGLASAWDKCHENDETLEEGILDRVKARATSVSNKVKNVGASVKAGAQTLKGDTTGAKSTIAGVENRKQSKVDIATSNYFKDGGKLDKQFNAFLSDLIKLSTEEIEKVALTNLSADVKLKKEIRDSFGSILSKYEQAYTKQAQQQAQQTTQQPQATTQQPQATQQPQTTT